MEIAQFNCGTRVLPFLSIVTLDKLMPLRLGFLITKMKMIFPFLNT